RSLYENSLDLRRSGSAALDLCYVAGGRCELFYEMSLAPWDYAAASLIVSEAGGIVTTMQGADLKLQGKTSVLAGGRSAYADFRQIYQSSE
ncbi:MAG: inositol monophosphatase, partial [Firmicutes bacterium]|nr:inositol monophosphatase [Bacillota bacterium]